MNDFEILSKIILKSGSIGVYFNKTTPYLSLRITVPKDSPEAKFLEEFHEFHQLGAIQQLSKSIVYVITGKNAEDLLTENDAVAVPLLEEKPEIHDLLWDYRTAMENKRKGRPFDHDEMKKIAEKLREKGGKARKRKSIEDCVPREVDEEFLKRFGMEEEYKVE